LGRRELEDGKTVVRSWDGVIPAPMVAAFWMTNSTAGQNRKKLLQNCIFTVSKFPISLFHKVGLFQCLWLCCYG